jgi:hypothetical protein
MTGYKAALVEETLSVVAELRKRGVKTVYLGFEHKPNKGLIYTTDDHILIKNTDVLECGEAA